MSNIYRTTRRAIPMTQQHLAEAAGVDVRTIRNLENGRPVSPETLLAVRSVLSMDQSEIETNATMHDPSIILASSRVVLATSIILRCTLMIAILGIGVAFHDIAILSASLFPLMICMIAGSLAGVLTPGPSRSDIAMILKTTILLPIGILPVASLPLVTSDTVTLTILVPIFVALYAAVGVASLLALAYTQLFDRDLESGRRGLEDVHDGLRTGRYRQSMIAALRRLTATPSLQSKDSHR